MPLRPDRRLQIRVGCALALVVGVNAVVLSVLAWSAHRVLSVSDRTVQLDVDLPLAVGAVLLGAIALVAVQARYGSRTAVSGLESEPVDGDGPRNVGARVRRLATQADIPLPSVAVADCDEPNCLTVGTQRSPTVVVTTGLLAELDDDELEAALAHEIAHLANRDLTVVSAVTAIVAIGDRLLERERTFRGLLAAIVVAVFSTAAGAGVLLLLLAVPFLAIAALVLVASAVARLLLEVNAITLGLFATTREYAADRGASRLTGDPAAVASALETLAGDLPERDARLRASATLGIVPRPLSVDRSGDEDGEDGAESWFDRWFAGQFRTWRRKLEQQDPGEQFTNWESQDRDRSPDRHSTDGAADDDGDGHADEPTTWDLEPYAASVVAPIRRVGGPIRERIRGALTWRPPTHPSTDARLERLRTLERQRRD